MANFIVFGLTSFMAINVYHDDPGIIFLLILIPVVGLILTFKANQIGDGKDYLKRFISLHFVIGIRFYVFTILFMIGAGFLVSFIPNQVIKGFLFGGLIAAFGIGFYYSLARSIKNVSKPKP